MPSHTFLWHDYETFGLQTRRDRPAQFAAIRTDDQLNEIGEPIMLYCQPAPDYLPNPQSCLITGITPQLCLERGVPEAAFAAQIEAAFSEPGTIGVGYNTIRFDDEVTRFLFWRNLIDPYAREWQNNCGRWDLLDVVRTAYALRRDGIVWPLHEGRPSFRLEHLTAANGLVHEAAHDALSDVRATIALARLIRQHQPRLFDFCLGLHKKERAIAEIAAPQLRPFLHVSGMFAAERGCLAMMWPLAVHPTNKNEILAWDLAHDPRQLLELDADTIRLRLFSKADALPPDTPRLPIKSIHLNKSPMVFGNLKTLSEEMRTHWGLQMEDALAHASSAAATPDLCLPATAAMTALWREVFQRPPAEAADVDEDLYGGFLGTADRRQLDALRALPADRLALEKPVFDDARLEELLFRYRARNFPETLSDAEQQRWEEHRVARLFDGEAGALTVEALFDAIDQLSDGIDAEGEAVLGALYDYAESIAPVRR